MNPADVINEEEVEESVGDMTARQASKLATIAGQLGSQLVTEDPKDEEKAEPAVK